MKTENACGFVHQALQNERFAFTRWFIVINTVSILRDIIVCLSSGNDNIDIDRSAKPQLARTSKAFLSIQIKNYKMDFIL